MTKPNLKEELKLWEKGFEIVAGLDEAGRGPLAGPVVASAVAINLKFKNPNLKIIQNFKFKKLNEVKDSKQLSAKKREELYKLLTNCSVIDWGVGIVSEKIIDKINILEATKLAMAKAVENLSKKSGRKPDFLLLDGNFSLNIDIPQKSIIKGDQKVFSISGASIIAKVTRDRIMEKMNKKYPQYGFGKHKGYPTKYHREMIKKYGMCKIHRKTFSLS